MTKQRNMKLTNSKFLAVKHSGVKLESRRERSLLSSMIYPHESPPPTFQQITLFVFHVHDDVSVSIRPSLLSLLLCSVEEHVLRSEKSFHTTTHTLMKCSNSGQKQTKGEIILKIRRGADFMSVCMSSW